VSEPTKALGCAVMALTSMGGSPPQAASANTVSPRMKITAKPFPFMFASLVGDSVAKFKTL
jgi:hypothetical protein